jgi:hypothetical protein
MLPDARRGQNRAVYIQRMNRAGRVAGHVNSETVVAARLFQRRGTAAAIGDDGGLPSGADQEREAPGFPSNAILPRKREVPPAVTDAPALYAFHRDPRDGRVGGWALGEVGAKLDDCTATCRVIAGGAAAVTRNLPRPRSLDPDGTDWDPEHMDTWDERIVMVADDEDFLEWQRDWLTDNGRG